MTDFSKKFRSFRAWKMAHPQDTPYNRRIISAHRKHPKASMTQLRGHPAKGRKLVSKLKPGRKKSPVKLIVVQGNIVSEDGSETGSQVYIEIYVRLADSNDEKYIGRIFKEFSDAGLRIFRVDESSERISVNLTGERKGKHVTSQKKALDNIVEMVQKELHPARKKTGVSYHKKGESRTGVHEKYKKGYEEE